jgi:hypothetical protein
MNALKKPKFPLLVAGLALAGIVFLAWTQPWFTLRLNDGSELSVDGDVAAPANAILALTCVVVFPALAIAGRLFRAVLGALEVFLGIILTFASSVAIASPIASSAATISAATGISGRDSITDLVATVSVAVWPFVSLVAGVLIALVGVLVIATSGRWPESGRKYSAVHTELADTDDPAARWDALSAGDDPTSER